MPSVDARDQVFATLDPTMRQIALPSGANAILSDTVGFITDLPTSLVAAFRATLEEVLSADLIVHVRDISHPDTEAQKRDVETVLTELGIDAADRASAHDRGLEQDRSADARAARRALGGRPGGSTGVNLLSAAEGTGLAPLLEAVDRRLAANRTVVELDLDYNSGESWPGCTGTARCSSAPTTAPAFISRLQSRHPSAPSSPTSSAGRSSRSRYARAQQHREPKKKQAAEDRSLRVGEETPQVGCRGGNPRDTAA